MDYHKKVIDPVILYSTFQQLYHIYFYNTGIRKIQNIPPSHYDYVYHFSQHHYDKLGTLEKYKEYILWIFAKYGKMTCKVLSEYVDEYLKELNNKTDFISFYPKIVAWLQKNKVQSWEQYTEVNGKEYPKIIYHYIYSNKEFPFEFIWYLGIIDKLKGTMKSQIKAVFSSELFSIKKKVESIQKQADFFNNEVKLIKEKMGWA